jgi:hypothetical protein
MYGYSWGMEDTGQASLPAVIKRNPWHQIAFLYRGYLEAGNDNGRNIPSQIGKNAGGPESVYLMVKTR